MLTSSKISVQMDTRILLNLLMLGLGILLGGVVGLVSLWLWLDYRAEPTRSLLAIFSANLVVLLPASWHGLMTSEAQMMGLPLAGQTQAYWYMARAGGMVAYLLLWLSVIWGLILSTKITDRLVPPLLAYGLHEFLSIGAVLFTAWHGLVLLGDDYIHFTLFHLIIPFIAPYEPVWTGLGIIGFYLSVTLTGSFYIRKYIGQRTWRTLHYLTFGVYGLVLLHGWMAGSDSELTLIKLMYLLTGGSMLFLTYYRLFTLRTKESKLVRG